jgi:hypothetical protein
LSRFFDFLVRWGEQVYADRQNNPRTYHYEWIPDLDNPKVKTADDTSTMETRTAEN